jgi:hypothetical protein
MLGGPSLPRLKWLSGGQGLTSFYLEPDWLGDLSWVVPVHNFLHTFEAGAPVQLWLRYDPAQLSSEEALRILQPVLATFGAKPFPAMHLISNRAEAEIAGELIQLSSRDLNDWTPQRWQEAAAA